MRSCLLLSIVSVLQLWLSTGALGSIHQLLPPIVAMNRDAGRGDVIFVLIQTENGKKGQFVVDSGAPRTLIDQSFEPEWGPCLGTISIGNQGVESTGKIYRTPKLFLANIPLSMPGTIIAVDSAIIAQGAAHSVAGVLGMDCLSNYCIQLDFRKRTMTFLQSEKLDKRNIGKAFPLILRDDGRFNISDNLAGVKGPGSLIDTGIGPDGWLSPKLSRLWRGPKNGTQLYPNGILDGMTYTNISIRVTAGDDSDDDQHNGIGLRLLARNLVTLDFRDKMMYLKQTSIGPLIDPDLESAIQYFKGLALNGQLPGWPKRTKAKASFPQSDSNGFIFTLQNPADLSIYNYFVAQPFGSRSWILESAWRTARDGHMIERYSTRGK